MFEHEAGRLRNLAGAEPAYWFTKHAREEMAKDDIARIDVETMLGRCRVTLVEESQGEETWRAEGPDFDGRQIAAVVVAYEGRHEVKVITAWAV